MSEETVNSEVYEKLTPQRKFIYDKLVSFFEKGANWRQGWASLEAPVNAVSQTRYKGNNFLSLLIAAMDRGYTDNRWLTYKQMRDRDWDFKTDAEGRSLGKGAGVTIEYFTLFDRETQRPFERSVLDGMDEAERQEYMRDNVRAMRKFYRVFNGDVIDGIPEKEPKEIDESGYNRRAESIIKQWNDTEAKILYGGHSAFYQRTTDTIHLPPKDQFVDLQEFYGTALHEIGHSTGHEKRLNRPFHKFGSEEYAEEELRAELASVFLEQDLGVSVEDNHLENNSAYIKSWLSAIKSDPNVLFKAIADADKIAGYVMQREPKKQTEPFAVVEDTDELGDPIYKLYMTSEHGQIRQAFSFQSREALMEELDKMSSLPFYADKEFREVSVDELRNMSLEEAEENEETAERERRLSEVREQPSEEYILPSEAAARAKPKHTPVDMSSRGLDSLARQDDRDIVEKALGGKYGASFEELYKGGSLIGDEEHDETSLLKRLAVYTSDEDQLMRILKSSGQYRDEKPNSHYMRLVKNALAEVENMRRRGAAQEPVFPVKKVRAGANTK